MGSCFDRRRRIRRIFRRGPGAGGRDPGLGRAPREREDGRDEDGQGVMTDRAVGAGEQEDPATDHAAGRLVGDVDCQPLVPLCDNP